MSDEISADQVSWLRERAEQRRKIWDDHRIMQLLEALEHTTELLVDTWHTAMDSDPEREVAVADARALLKSLRGAPQELPTSHEVG